MTEPMGLFTDTSLCTGCKACEVACKQWWGLPARDGGSVPFEGDGYDNQDTLGGETWRHVKTIEQPQSDGSIRWLMMSDSCKHCVQAPCLEVCPVNAIVRTEFGSIAVRADVCTGCGACVPACPFGAMAINPMTDTAMTCTMCPDRIGAGLEPACVQACPTGSIQFGSVEKLHLDAEARLQDLKDQGATGANLYGAEEEMLGGLNAFYLLMDEAERYGLPATASLPSRRTGIGGLITAIGVAVTGVVGVASLRKSRMDALGHAAAPDASGESELET